LADLGIAQSCRAYRPMSVSHYKASWVGGENWALPTWPGPDHDGEHWDRARLERHYAPWAELARQGVGVHCGEGGAFKHTPHAIVLAWLRDVLEILKGHGIGWALWNLRGAFGILDSGRADVACEDWHGLKLDRKLLDLLRQF
jgi:endoglucanase